MRNFNIESLVFTAQVVCVYQKGNMQNRCVFVLRMIIIAHKDTHTMKCKL